MIPSWVVRTEEQDRAELEIELTPHHLSEEVVSVVGREAIRLDNCGASPKNCSPIWIG